MGRGNSFVDGVWFTRWYICESRDSSDDARHGPSTSWMAQHWHPLVGTRSIAVGIKGAGWFFGETP